MQTTIHNESLTLTVDNHGADYMGLADISVRNGRNHHGNRAFFRMLHGRAASDRRNKGESVWIGRTPDSNTCIRIIYGRFL